MALPEQQQVVGRTLGYCSNRRLYGALYLKMVLVIQCISILALQYAL